MNIKRVEKNFKKLNDNICFFEDSVEFVEDRLGKRLLIDISDIEEKYFSEIEDLVKILNDRKHVIFNKAHKKIVLD